MNQIFVFAYGNAGDGSSIWVHCNSDDAAETVRRFNRDGMLTDTYTEEQLWQMRSDAVQYGFVKQLIPQRWEYRIEEIRDDGNYLACPAQGKYSLSQGPSEDYAPAQWKPLNELGSRGWELTSTWTDGDQTFAAFKRAVK